MENWWYLMAMITQVQTFPEILITASFFLKLTASYFAINFSVQFLSYIHSRRFWPMNSYPARERERERERNFSQMKSRNHIDLKRERAIYIGNDICISGLDKQTCACIYILCTREQRSYVRALPMYEGKLRWSLYTRRTLFAWLH